MQAEHVIYSGFLARKLLKSLGMHSLQTKHFPHPMKREFVKRVLDFLNSKIGCSENLPLHIRKTRPH
jgi:hypothetical protein